ncbi:MAG: RagB/SusD family nutrient uptake outer membrane protein [Alistipes sp.]|nr:RagB/SusD family nutrient uptake outer membrane protein [Alistipes sp.]
MKKFLLYSVALLTSAAMITSCLGDLDAEPLADTTITADKAFESPESYDQYVNYAYSYFSLVSQGDPGSSDIAVSDAGQSEFTRQYMFLNELSADGLKCIWGDDYVDGLQYNKWTTTNAAVMAVYLRGLKGVAICNQFLHESVSSDGAVSGRGHDSKLSDVRAYRAEMRLLRAIYYEILLDLYGNPPLVLPENIGSTNFPTQLGRKGLFAWVENELLELTKDEYLPATRVAYPRLSKGAAWAVLARLYLNAEVYSGEARWADAKNAAEKVISEGGYELCENYADLFRQDNSTNGAQNEFIVASLYDAQKTQSWGGTTHLLYASVNSDLRTVVSSMFGFSSDIYKNQWNGYHVSDEFVQKNFALQGVEWGQTNSWGYDRAANDQRAMFTNAGFKQQFENEVSDITTGWACLKWVPLTSDNRPNLIELDIEFSSADFPIFRLAEMYLISAEAEARMSGGTLTSSANGYKRIAELRERANGVADMPLTIDLDYILQERTRELYWEGHRRVDLIRYGYYTSASYPWPYKGGIPAGTVSLSDHLTVFPIITTDLIANPNLEQNAGY